ncbi:hypothetical protein ACFL96_05125 [Thermoproteota archaeon]
MESNENRPGYDTETDADIPLEVEEPVEDDNALFEEVMPGRKWKRKASDFYHRIRRPVKTVMITGMTLASGWIAACIYYNMPFTPTYEQPPAPITDYDTDSAVHDEDGKLMMRLRQDKEILKAPDGRLIMRDKKTTDMYLEPDKLEEILKQFNQKTQAPGKSYLTPPSQKKSEPLMIRYNTDYNI